jgi:surface polysaccharide O-acyltransferase-like enzyme
LDPKSENISLPVDLIRTVAIILVILLHAAIEPHPIVKIVSQEEVVRWWASNVYNSLARPCVPLFVMLTGALLLQTSKVDESLSVFFRKRLRRIGLPFLFWGMAYFAWRFFVNGEAFTASSILQGVLTGPYKHFWFLYLLAGLYLITPALRVLVTHSSWKILRYFLLVWFVGTAIVPLLTLFGPFSLNPNVFMMTGWLGYFILGACLVKVRLRPSILYLILVLGFLWTIIGTYFVVGTIGARLGEFFYDFFSVNVIMASLALFLLLSAVPPQKVERRFPRVNRVLHQISQNTLPIYLFHVMVMETLQKGYLGFKISLTTMNPVLEIPLITVVTLFICLGLLIPLKKTTCLRRLIG